MYSQRDFFYAVLSQEGKPCIGWLAPDQEGMRHKVFDNLEEMLAYASELDYRTANYYFAISTLRERSVMVGGKKRVRTQKNAAYTRVLILDIDFKDGHYSDVETALADVNALASAHGLPTPIAVSSGYGLHVYWPFAEGIPSDEWTALAKRFKAAASMFYPHLFADSSRVSDSASVLRIPDSFNLKYEDQVPVTIVQWLDGLVDVGELKEKFSGIKIETNLNVDVGTQVTPQPPAELGKVAKNCNWTADYLKNRADATEPAWYAMLGLAPYLEHTGKNGVISDEAIAQFLSKGHPSYDPNVALAKYQQAKASQTGPTTCTRLAGINPNPCKECPFRTTVTTPIQTARLAREALQEEKVVTKVIDDEGIVHEEEVTIPLYPSPYFRGENGGVFVRAKEKQEDGTWLEVIEKVYDYDLYPIKRYRTELIENEVMEIHLWLPHDGLRKFKLPTALLAEHKKLAIFLAEKGVIAEYGKGPRVAKYMVDYVRHLQTVGAAEVEFGRFGWRDIKSAKPKFVVGNGYIDHEGSLQPGSFAAFLKDAAKAVVTAGDLDEWRKGFMVYEHMPDSEAFILASLMGFASPLMALTPYKGVLYNMVAASAAGKSTSLRVMSSVWGQPNENHVSVRDNEIPVYNFIGYLNAIPVAMDELTHMDSDALARFALSFTSGRGKMRANRDGTNRINETEWETIVVGTSNTSLYDKLASHRKGYTAEAMRIFELNLPESQKMYEAHVKKRTKLLERNYGHAGRIYMSWLIQNIESVQALLEKAIQDITDKGQLRNEERFWGAMFGCVLVGGQIAKKLGLHNYDVKKVVAKFTESSSEVREAIRNSQSDPVSLLSDFFNNNLDGILKMDAQGKPYLGIDNRAASTMRTIKVRMELDEDHNPKTAYISVPSFRDHCSLKKVDPSWINRELVTMGIMAKASKNMRLTSGSGISGGTSIKCYTVDLTHPKMQEISIDFNAEQAEEQDNGQQ